MSLNLSSSITKVNQLSGQEIELWIAMQSSTKRPISPFMSYQFSLACAEAGRDINVAFFYDSNDFSFLFPFEYRSFSDRIFSAATRVGGSMSDCMGVLAKDELMVLPESVLTRFNSVYFDHSPLALWDATGCDLQNSQVARVLNIGASIADYWESRHTLHKQRLANLANRRRKIVKEYGALSFIESDLVTQDQVDFVIAQKRCQYKKTNAKDIFLDPFPAKLLHTLRKSGTTSCKLFLSELYVGDKWVASHLGIRNGSLLHYWFPVYSEAFSSFSPGLLLLEDIINHMPQNALQLIDFGEGDADYKRMFATDEFRNFKAFINTISIGGLMSKAIVAIKWRLEKLCSSTI